jgi:hypothetical protein
MANKTPKEQTCKLFNGDRVQCVHSHNQIGLEYQKIYTIREDEKINKGKKRLIKLCELPGKWGRKRFKKL